MAQNGYAITKGKHAFFSTRSKQVSFVPCHGYQSQDFVEAFHTIIDVLDGSKKMKPISNLFKGELMNIAQCQNEKCMFKHSRGETSYSLQLMVRGNKNMKQFGE